MKAICKYIVFKLFIVLIFLILMLKSPFQGGSIKCMYVWIYTMNEVPGGVGEMDCTFSHRVINLFGYQLSFFCHSLAAHW